MDDTSIASPGLAGAATHDERAGSHAKARHDTDELTREVSGVYDELAASLLRYSAGICHDYDLAGEAVQETFFRYFLHRQEGVQITNTKAWMFRVLRNIMFDLLKERSASSAVELDRANELPATGPTVAEVVELEQLKARLPTFLSPREMECIQLREEGLQYDEIAAALNLTIGRVGAILSGATVKLRRALG